MKHAGWCGKTTAQNLRAPDGSTRDVIRARTPGGASIVVGRIATVCTCSSNRTARLLARLEARGYDGRPRA